MNYLGFVFFSQLMFRGSHVRSYLCKVKLCNDWESVTNDFVFKHIFSCITGIEKYCNIAYNWTKLFLGFLPKFVFTIKLKKIYLQTSPALYSAGDLGAGFVANFMFCCIFDHALKKNLKFNGLRKRFYSVFLCVSSFHYHHLQLDTQKLNYLLPFPEYLKSIQVDSSLLTGCAAVLWNDSI